MAEAEFISPWAQPAPTPPPAPPVATPADRLRGAAWGVISTGLLFAWLSWQMGWVWGVAGVFGVFVHEFGHLLVINALGCGPSTIRIIPFLGGAATMPRSPDSDLKAVVISLAGPVAGLLATAPFFAASAITGDHRWLGGAFFIAGFNLLNLLPAPPLDGSKALGPILARIHPVLERVALVLVGVAAVAWAVSRGSIVLPVFIGLSVLTSLRRGALRPNARPLTWLEWTAALALYAGAVVLCAIVLMAAWPGASLAEPMLTLGPPGGRP
jgi:Zn-dependent protease